MSQPRVRTGAVIGLLVTAPVLALLYLARELVGLPFVPFDVFDWLAHVLPGGVVTAGIDAIVAALRAAGAGDLSAAARTAEQVLAVLGVLAVGAAAGAVVFTLLRRGRLPPRAAGPAIGAAVAIPMAWISAARGAAETGPVAGAVWIVVVFLGWGAAAGRSWRRLTADPDAAGPETRPTASTAGAGAASGRASFEAVDRRRFLVRLGGATAVITVAGAGAGVLVGTERGREGRAGVRREPWSSRHPLSNAGADVTPVPGTRPELTPVPDHYRIDINTRAPVVDEESWRLAVGGLLAAPFELTLDQLLSRYDPVHRFITLSCISNPIAGDLIGTTRWTGFRLEELLAEADPGRTATHLRVRSVDGFHETVPLDLVHRDPRILLAYAWDGLPLPPEHGFPLRIYIPDRYGMKQPKRIESIEVVDTYAPGYWVERGWNREARMHATSVIDVVASDRLAERAEGHTVPIGGIAHAGDRGIARVEIRIDDGPWRLARLREPHSGLAWVLWRYDRAFEPGEHTLTVRCVDGEGNRQIPERTPVRPDGATGLHSRTIEL